MRLHVVNLLTMQLSVVVALLTKCQGVFSLLLERQKIQQGKVTA